MNITSPILAGAIRVAEMPGDSMTSILKVIGPTTGLFDDNPDGGLGMVMSVLAGVAAALAVAILFSIYLRTGHRSLRDIIKHGLAAVLALGLIAFVISDMRHAALAYLGLNPTRPAIEFEIRLPRTELTLTDAQIELRTDLNQRLAKLQDALDQTADGRSVLHGTVTLDYRTTERVVVLNLPGQAQRQFKLRLPASPTHSDRFSPWHLSDGIADNAGPNDAFAIRYRVL
jgi:hypothetical protein